MFLEERSDEDLLVQQRVRFIIDFQIQTAHLTHHIDVNSIHRKTLNYDALQNNCIIDSILLIMINVDKAKGNN